jgi:hypothetical protein
MVKDRGMVFCLSPLFVPLRAVWGHDADKRDRGVTGWNEIEQWPTAAEDQIWQ